MISGCLLCRYCPDCKTDRSEVIGAGEKMKLSKKKASMVSNKRGSNRDWGKVLTIKNLMAVHVCMYIRTFS